MAGLETKIGDLRMRTPLIALSGVFGIEYVPLLAELTGVGAVVTKSVTLRPRTGNPVPIGERVVPVFKPSNNFKLSIGITPDDLRKKEKALMG